jgi:uncharacterized damage-inducible protein DinB
VKTTFRSKSCAWYAVVALGAATLAFASPTLDYYQKHFKTSGDFTVAVADQMPDADYGFKLTPAQMSFGQQIEHIANANMYFFSVLAGDKPSNAKPASSNKADVIAFLKKSNDYCQKVLAGVTAEQLAKSYKSEDGEMTGTELIMLSLDHTTHHRAQAEMYLRAKGIKPTDYRF